MNEGEEKRGPKRVKKVRFRFGMLVPLVVFCGAIGGLMYFCISTYYRIEAGTYGSEAKLAGVWVIDREKMVELGAIAETESDGEGGVQENVGIADDANSDDEPTDDEPAGDELTGDGPDGGVLSVDGDEPAEDTAEDTGKAVEEDADEEKGQQQEIAIDGDDEEGNGINAFMKEIEKVRAGLLEGGRISLKSDRTAKIEFGGGVVDEGAEGEWSVLRVNGATMVVSFRLLVSPDELEYQETPAGPVFFSVEMDGDDAFVVLELEAPGQRTAPLEFPLHFRRQ